MSEPAVLVRGLAKRFGDTVALRDVDLDVSRGSIVGLVGPNGAGKTTLFRILAGALGADAGTVAVLGRDISSELAVIRKEIGYMPQAPVLYEDLTVRENVAFFARGHIGNGVAERVKAVVDFVGLGVDVDRQVQTLSGGQRQRVSLAAALAHEPELLFLDEPTAGVDPELRQSFWGRFRRLADSGVTLLVSTHQMDEVVHCDRVVLLLGGAVLADTTPHELSASGGGTVRIVEHGEVSTRDLGSIPEGLPQFLRSRGLDPGVERIEVEPSTLEDVILGLINGRERGE